MEYNLKNFQTAVEKKPDDALKTLRDELKFTAEGVAGMIEKNPELCTTYFTQLIGQPFDATNAGHITLVLEAGIKGNDAMANTMDFCYTNFIKKSSKAKRKSSKSSGAGRGRAGTDWSEKEIPFSEGSGQHTMFVVGQKFTGTLKEFQDAADIALTKAGHEGIKSASLMAHFRRNLAKRNYTVTVDKETKAFAIVKGAIPTKPATPEPVAA